MTVDQLVDRFAEIGVAQNTAELMGKISKYNKLYRQMKDVDTELRARGEDARRALLRLYSHPNMQVRLQAAKKNASRCARGGSACDRGNQEVPMVSSSA